MLFNSFRKNKVIFEERNGAAHHQIAGFSRGLYPAAARKNGGEKLRRAAPFRKGHFGHFERFPSDMVPPNAVSRPLFGSCGRSFCVKKKNPRNFGDGFLKAIRDELVSRVLSPRNFCGSTAIYLGRPSPIGSSVIHGALPDGQPYVGEAQTCIGRGLHGTPCYHGVGELLPRLSTLARRRRDRSLWAP